MPEFHPTETTFRSGSRTLPGEYYTSPEIFAEEKERIFARRWHCVGREARLARRGDYFLCTIADESLILVQDREGTARAHFNVCRHRGTRLCREEAGHLAETIQCPYHAWTYATDGQLIGAPHMQDVAGFDKKDYPLHAAAVASWQGFLFTNIAEKPTPFADEWAAAIARLARFNMRDLHSGHRAVYDVHANWKLVFQNYSECLHCPVIHPELSTVLPYQSGANDLTEGPFLGGYMEIAPPNESATLSGRACGRLVDPSLSAEDRRRAFYYSLMPNLMLSIHPDYVNYYLLQPIAVNRTLVESEWLFHPETLAGAAGDRAAAGEGRAGERAGAGKADRAAFNPRDAIEFWEITNRQDWDIVERSQQGIASRRYTPGPYSARESIPAAWDREYLRLMGRA